MIHVDKFYFEGSRSVKREPIHFKKGINLIIGEKSPTDATEKMNSVGKSLLIEFIDHCLLRDVTDGRIAKIPLVILNDEVYICLDLLHTDGEKNAKITIKRTRDDKKPIVIIVDGQKSEFQKIEKAREFLAHFVFLQEKNTKPTLRNILMLLIRNEQTNYENIVKSVHGQRAFTSLIKPHLYLFDFDIDLIDKIGGVIKDREEVQTALREIRSRLEAEGLNSKKIKSRINELEGELEKLYSAIRLLQPSEGSVQFEKEYRQLELKLLKIVEKITATEVSIQKIKDLPAPEKVDAEDVRVIYNQYQIGLGDIVKKSLDEVIGFKKRIEDFQNELLTKKVEDLQAQLVDFERERTNIDFKLAKLNERAGLKKKVHSLEHAFREREQKVAELRRLQDSHEMIEKRDRDKLKLDRTKTELLDALSGLIFEKQKNIEAFEKGLKTVHEYIYGNQDCHFDIKVKEGSKEFVEIDYRVSLDGGAGVNRIRTFIYDTLLMLNASTAGRHPGFLIHDNIFAGAGRDDMAKSLNFLSAQEGNLNFQYIVTINKDEFDTKIGNFTFDYLDKVRVTLTQNEKLLMTSYKEV